MWQLTQASSPMLLPFCSSSLRRNCSLFSLLPYGKKSVYTFCKTELAHFLLHLSSHLLSTTHSHVWFLQPLVRWYTSWEEWLWGQTDLSLNSSFILIICVILVKLPTLSKLSLPHLLKKKRSDVILSVSS